MLSIHLLVTKVRSKTEVVWEKTEEVLVIISDILTKLQCCWFIHWIRFAALRDVETVECHYKWCALKSSQTIALADSWSCINFLSTVYSLLLSFWDFSL